MTLAEKKIRTLGATGGIMYLSRTQLEQVRQKFPHAKIVRVEDPAPMVKGFHAYIVENWKEIAV